MIKMKYSMPKKDKESSGVQHADDASLEGKDYVRDWVIKGIHVINFITN